MKVFILYLLIALLVLSVQASLFFNTTRPDLMLILVCFYSLKYGQLKGMAYGACTGLLVDSASGFILGPNILSKAIAGFLMSSVRQKFFQWNIVISTLLIGFFSIADIFLVYICLGTFAGYSYVNRAFDTSIKQVIFTAGISMILYPLFKPEEENKPFL